MADARFTLLNRTNEIGANSYLLEIGDTRMVLDAGMHPKENGARSIPRYEDLRHDSIDAIIVTHSHLDHVGTLPILMRDQPSARVFMTPPTAALAEALLHNSVNVMKSQLVELGIEEYPLFTHRAIDELVPRASKWYVSAPQRPLFLEAIPRRLPEPTRCRPGPPYWD